MQTRAGRWIVFALLLVTGTGAAVLTWTIEKGLLAFDAAERGVTGDTDRLIDVAHGIAAAQAGYVAPGGPIEPLFERVASGVDRLSSGLEALRQNTRAPESSSPVQAAADATATLARTDQAIRENLAIGETLMAADLIFGDARASVDAIRAALLRVRSTETAAFANERQRLKQQEWTALGSAAGLWLVGLLLLMRRPRTPASKPDTTPVPEPQPEIPAVAPASIDLAAAADLCTAISRITSTAELPDLLARTAALMDASGLIVWMGAGEELFAATAHGYDPRVIGRLGPIGRSADNATAAAWRTGELRTVSGDLVTNGAIVAPMFGPESCIGVLAAEVRHGRESDPAARAVTAIVAAQLATVVVAWPGASSAASKAV